jgi:hypothetical protein
MLCNKGDILYERFTAFADGVDDAGISGGCGHFFFLPLLCQGFVRIEDALDSVPHYFVFAVKNTAYENGGEFSRLAPDFNSCYRIDLLLPVELKHWYDLSSDIACNGTAALLSALKTQPASP